MELKDVALLNLHKYPKVNFEQLKSYFACNKVVLFGVAPLRIQLSEVSLNQPVEHASVKILATFNFTEMMEDVERKKAFWAVMKAF